MRDTCLLWAVSLLTGCGSALHLPDDLGEPLAVVAASIDGEAPQSVNTRSLRAALIWAAMPSSPVVCHRGTDPESEIACNHRPDGLGALAASHVVAVKPVFPASLEVPIYELPDEKLLGGVGDARFGYAELVLFADGNRNGVLDLVDGSATVSADTVVASSGRGQEALLHYLIYREGGVAPEWQMFTALGCAAPPQGFSIVRVNLDEPDDCWMGKTTVPLRFVDSDAVRSVICEPQKNLGTHPSQPPPPDSEVTCIDGTRLEFVVDPERYCAEWQEYALIGCDSDVVCAEPEWDLTEEPPEWWPCQ